ncbi:FkbM family methyltransferase [Pectobacterium cacticida]|uniref:FkbM family methyltransferase n=1 Tax=Pectobacterium cacticida TaxID=69221 RepID=A0ABZ2G4G3_9GAMM|nr:FkbM family methyltransferase [Pectobacterium cacticida]UYX05481.1 FkbM family methyltransferase [Pectobacterium cacticida]
MLAKIIEKNNKDMYRDIETIKNNKCTVVLIGVSQYSLMMFYFLQKNDVKVDIISVNKKYLNKGDSFLGKDIIPLEDVVSRQECFNYIIGFQPINDDFFEMISLNSKFVFFYDILNINNVNVSYNFIKENEGELQWFYERLNDDLSRGSLTAFINQRISYKADYCKKVYSDNIYFLDSIVDFMDDEVFVDCGAYTGDTILSFLSNYRKKGFLKPKKVYGLEPDENNFQQLTTTMEGFDFCQVINSGVWSDNARISFLKGEGELSRIDFENKSDFIDVISIDSLLNGDKATFIKMDIEGAELAALRGSENTIRNYKPKLAISLYHKPEDLIEIPFYLNSLNPNYKFYLRCHQRYFSVDMVLYAIM